MVYFLGFLDNSKKIYDHLKNLSKCFDYKDLQNDPETFFKNTTEFFKQKFEANSISYSNLPEKLLSSKTPNETNSPLLWFPERKDFIKEFFPGLIHNGRKFKLVVTGNTGVGKSHLALMAALLLRSKIDTFTTIYIPNTEVFRDTPLDFLPDEIFLWFYDVIANSNWLKIIINVTYKEIKTNNNLMRV